MYLVKLYIFLNYIIYTIKKRFNLTKMAKTYFDISDFLPKYPNIYPVSEDLFNLYTTSFEESIYKKKEFYQNKLELTEKLPNTAGELFNHQKIIANFLSSKSPYDQLLLAHEMGCVDPNTPIPLWNGTVKRAYEIKENDYLIGDDGTPRKVTSVINGSADMYKITQDNGMSYIVNGEHVLTLKILNNYKITWIKSINAWYMFWFDKSERKIRSRTISCIPNNIESKNQAYKNMLDFRELVYEDDVFEIKVVDYVNLSLSEKYILRGYKCSAINWPQEKTKLHPYDYGFQLKNTEYILESYFINSIENRLQLLAGIIDSNNGPIFDKNVTYISQLKYLTISLGLMFKELENQICIYGKEIPVKFVSIDELFELPDNHLTSIISVECLGYGKYVGWTITGNRRFLLNDFTVTHNTGKTCSSIAAIEQVRSENNGITGALILARGEGLINNYVNELVFKCTDGSYVPEDFENLTELEKVHRINKIVKKFYTLETFEVFAKKIKNMSDDNIIKNYSNKFIVIDEVHNIRIQDEEDETIYDQIHRFLHVIKNSKVILMSGTPMKDTVDEIAAVMNLILPEDLQLPTGEDFITEYFDENSFGKLSVKQDKALELKEILKGRVSYLRAMRSNVTKTFVGEQAGGLDHFKVVEDYMSEFQTKTYKKAYISDTTEKRGIYTQSRQASLFVYPDGSFGSEGFKKYIKRISRKKVSTKQKRGKDGEIKEEKISETYTFVLSDELRNEFKDINSVEDKLQKLRQFSSKYADTIETILKCREEGKSVFVYCEYVQGSGAILFSKLLELFGFSASNGLEGKGSERARYALITNMTASQKEIKTIVNRFNQPDNMNGKIINVIIGSKIIGEGFSLYNIQSEQILTPHWNYSETAQAIARGYRLGSHRALLENGIEPVVEIYQRVSIPEGASKSLPSIDLNMYEISEKKDINIKAVERLLKETAFDCALNYKRNHIVGYDNETECDYTNCEYVCDDIPMDLLEIELDKEELDYSSYNISKSVKVIIEKIKEMFRKIFRKNLNTILEELLGYTTFEIISALRIIINETIPIINRYGIISYLKEENNIYFLVDNMFNYGIVSEYYTKYPHVDYKKDYDSIIKNIYSELYPLLINSLVEIGNNAGDDLVEEKITNILKQLPLELQEYFIETAILAKEQDIEHNLLIRNIVLDVYKPFYRNIKNKWVSFLLKDQNIIRCLDLETENIWVNCEENITEILNEERKQEQGELEDNPYGYYGQYSKINNNFCIRDVTNIKAKTGKKNTRTSGKNCQSWKLEELLNLIVNVLQIPPTETYLAKKSDEDLLKLIQLSKGKTKKILENYNIEELDGEYLRRALYWGEGRFSKNDLCKVTRNWFEENNLLVEDDTCGEKGKKKI